MKLIAVLTSLLMIPLLLEARTPPAKGRPLPSDSLYNLDAQWLNQNGKSVALSDFRGAPVIISMVYLKCTYSCPLTVVQMKEVEKALTPEMKKKTQFLLATFDSINDTPAALLQYAHKNHLDNPLWTFLTTKNETSVRELSALLDFKYKKLDSGEFEHSYALIALDTDGKIIGRTEGSDMNPKSIADLINKTTTPAIKSPSF